MSVLAKQVELVEWCTPHRVCFIVIKECWQCCSSLAIIYAQMLTRMLSAFVAVLPYRYCSRHYKIAVTISLQLQLQRESKIVIAIYDDIDEYSLYIREK